MTEALNAGQKLKQKLRLGKTTLVTLEAPPFREK